MNRFIRGLVGVSIIAVSLVTGVSATAAPAGDRAAAAPADGLSVAVLAAMQRDLGLTADQAKLRVAQQAKAIELDKTLQASLGTAFGGSWFDAASGKLVVGVTDARRVAEVAAAGARPRVVNRSMAQLRAITAELDALAGRPAGTPRAAAAGQRQAAVAGLTSWYIDQMTNSVVVTTLNGQPRAAALDGLSKYGDAVRVEHTDVAPTTTDPWLDGGDQILYPSGGWCSAGFNLRNPSTGQGYLLIAGHCGTGTVRGHHGTTIGPVLQAWFPTFDDAIIRNDYPGTWIQGPWVDTNPSEGGVIVINTWSDAPVGTFMCKSGVTTKLTCGYINVKDETVNYAQGPVYGMTRHSACVEPGDSGGSNFTGSSAEGVTSGAQLYWDGSRYRCGQVFGYQNVSWYFPIADSLPYYQAVYGVTLW